jgi:LysR family positive regulator for ilvC
MVALGFVVGVVPLLVLRASPVREGVRVLDVAPELAPFRIGLCCRRQALENPLVESLWSLAGESRGAADSARGAAV